MYVNSTTSPLKCHYKGTLYQKLSMLSIFLGKKIATCIYTAIGLIQMSNIWYVLMVVLVHHMLMSITNVTTIFKFDFK